MISSRPEKVNLNLRVVGSISAIGRDGQVERLLMEAAKTVNSRKATRIGISPSSKGIYRVDVRFERLNGTRLQTYKQYFRVGPSRRLGRIGFSRQTVAPGESAIVRLENLGTTVLRTGYGYGIERFTGFTWEPDPTMQDNRLRIRVLRLLSPRESFDCWQLAVPAEQPAGRYRIYKRVPGPDPFIAQEFSVVP